MTRPLTGRPIWSSRGHRLDGTIPREQLVDDGRCSGDESDAANAARARLLVKTPTAR